MKKEERKDWIFWTPRILSIIFIVFLSVFALDIFDLNLGFWGTILGLFMHLIPSFILIIILLVSWKHELVGAIAFILAGIFYILILLITGFKWYMLVWLLQITGPAFFIGILFWLNWKRK